MGVAPILFLLLTTQVGNPPPTDARITAAIAGLQQYLLAQQMQNTGGFPEGRYANSDQAGGGTALVVTALLASGVSAQHPQMQRAIRYLDTITPRGVYARALRAHVWARLPDDYHHKLVTDARWLTQAADEHGRFGYTNPGVGAFNHSTTHYGILGLWEAAKRNVHVKPQFWQSAVAHFRRAQRGDGGWGYMPDTDSTGSMTAAGLTVLLIAQQEAQRGQMKPDPRTAFPIAEGLAWFDKHFDGPDNPFGAWRLYYLYAVERVALACGRRYFGEHDWFVTGAQWILDNLIDDGGLPGGVIDSAFALMFLSRGRVPVWAAKLELTDTPWNNRPHDLYYLTQYLSEFREGEMNWQTVNIDAPPEHWQQTPLLYLASDDALELTPQRKAALKRYLDTGGTLLCNPDMGSMRFIRSIHALAAELYPQWPLRELQDDHLLYSALHQIPGRGAQKVFAVGNGARELIVLADRDWAFQWQSADTRGRNAAWKLPTNLWTIVTDRGLLRARLDERFDEPIEREQVGTFTVGQLRYDGNWRPEPAAWDTFATTLFNRTGLRVRTVVVEFGDLEFTPVDLVHLTGVEPHAFEASQLEALMAYAKRGGTVLIETVGGRGRFAADLEAQLDRGAAPLAATHPIISGAIDARRVRYTRYAVARMGVGRWPRIGAVFVDDRPALIFSNEDLSLAMLRMTHWGIVGYRPQSAEALMTNLAMHAYHVRNQAR